MLRCTHFSLEIFEGGGGVREMIVGLYTESWRAVTFFICFGLFAVILYGTPVVSTGSSEESGKVPPEKPFAVASSAHVPVSLPQ